MEGAEAMTQTTTSPRASTGAPATAGVSPMKALAVTAFGGPARLMDMPRPKLDDNSAIIRVHYSGVSVGTEMWIATGRRKDYGEPPFINGYQATGEVVELGSACEGFALGDLVAAFCSGSHAQFITSNKAYLHILPDAYLARPASLFVQPSVGANALSMAGVNTGDTTWVVGQGLIGQATAQIARLRGAYVIASDVSPERLELSRRYCADWVIDASKVEGGKVSKEIKKRLAGGVDVCLESTGFQALLDDALDAVVWGGRFVFEGFYPDTVTYTFSIPHAKQLRAFYPVFIGTHANREGVIRMMANKLLRMDPLISDEVKWTDAESIYNRLFTKERDRFNGVVIDWR
jgi:2-desacetyl-2-hydroxyethyl bacteriochlorophyllide A dehydrogenase